MSTILDTIADYARARVAKDRETVSAEAMRAQAAAGGKANGKSFYDAVVQAHREYRKLRRPGDILPERHKPSGLYKGWIVPKGLF